MCQFAYGALLIILLAVEANNTVSYLVDTPTCRIPNINPFNKKAMAMFKGYKKIPCDPTPRVVDLVKDKVTLQYSLHVNNTAAQEANITSPVCCLRIAERNNDIHFNLSECTNFTDQVTVPYTAEYNLVTCFDTNQTSPYPLYRHANFLIQAKETIKNRFAKFTASKNKMAPSVLIFGMDSVGRLNMQRSMPKVLQFMRDNKFYDLKGYNKMGDNTFPNIMAALAGLSEVDVPKNHCDARKLKGLENCQIIWKDFEKYGYATAYSEDYTAFSTFNYLKKGFHKQAVDYYGRTGILLLEDKVQSLSDLFAGRCAGQRYLVEYIYTQGLDFAEFYKGHPYFGIFWANSLTHEDVRDLLLMEDQLLSALHQSKSRGILNNSIVIIMSDHGARFPPSIDLSSGWYDVRLPAMFISLPTWFKDKHPDAAKGLEINQNRLTSPYDLYSTLKDILRLSGRVPSSQNDVAHSCPTCQSLFQPVPVNRTCDQAGIPSQFCTCQTFKPVGDAKLAEKAAEFAVAHINQVVQEKLVKLKLSGSLCLQLSLKKVLRASMSSTKTLLLKIETHPGHANYEVGVQYHTKGKETVFKIDGMITRQNLYGLHAFCVQDLELKNFCECSEKHVED